MRHITSRIAPQTPIEAYDGISPTQPVATAIRPTVTTSALRRPKLSPYQPITIAPIGRIRKPTAKVAKLARSEAIGSVEGKNARPIASAKKP